MLSIVCSKLNKSLRPLLVPTSEPLLKQPDVINKSVCPFQSRNQPQTTPPIRVLAAARPIPSSTSSAHGLAQNQHHHRRRFCHPRRLLTMTAYSDRFEFAYWNSGAAKQSLARVRVAGGNDRQTTQPAALPNAATLSFFLGVANNSTL